MENSSEKCGLTSSCHSEMCVDFGKNEQSREKKSKREPIQSKQYACIDEAEKNNTRKWGRAIAL